mgnify:CR=1 FL=1
MAGPILPGSRTGYRTTAAAFKLIVLFVLLGVITLVWVFWTALKDADKIYEDSGYSDQYRLINTNR